MHARQICARGRDGCGLPATGLGLPVSPPSPSPPRASIAQWAGPSTGGQNGAGRLGATARSSHWLRHHGKAPPVHPAAGGTTAAARWVEGALLWQRSRCGAPRSGTETPHPTLSSHAGSHLLDHRGPWRGEQQDGEPRAHGLHPPHCTGSASAVPPAGKDSVDLSSLHHLGHKNSNV